MASRSTACLVICMLVAGACDPTRGSTDTVTHAVAPAAVSPPESLRVVWDTARFYTWWAGQAAARDERGRDSLRQALPPHIEPTHLRLVDLRAPAPHLVFSLPESLEGDHWQTRLLLERPVQSLLLGVPTDTAGRFGGAGSCGDVRPLLAIVPGGQWVTVDLNVSCDDSTGPADVDFYLYSLPGEVWPHVEIVTSGPACAPASLYRYDAAQWRYTRVRTACAP